MLKKVMVNHKIKYSDANGNMRTLYIHTRSMAETILVIRALRTRVAMTDVVIFPGDILLQSDVPMLLTSRVEAA